MSSPSDFTIVDDVLRFIGYVNVPATTWYLRPREYKRLQHLKDAGFLDDLIDKEDVIDTLSVIRAIVFSKSPLTNSKQSIYGIVDEWNADTPKVNSSYWDFIDDVIKGVNNGNHSGHRVHQEPDRNYVKIDDVWHMVHIGDYDPEVDPRPQQVETQIKQTETEEMSKVTAVVASNKAAGTVAARLKAGSVLNTAAISAIKKSKVVPMMLRGYLDSPFAPLVVANLAMFATTYTTNPKAKQAAQLMMDAAALTLANQVDIESIVASLIENPAVAAVLTGDTQE